MFESRKILCTLIPSSCDLESIVKAQKDNFELFTKDMTPSITRNDNNKIDINTIPNLSALQDFLSCDNNIWEDIYVLEQESNLRSI